MDQWDLVTYAGISAAVVMLVGFAKKLFPAAVSGKEPHVSLGLSVLVGVVSKLTIPGAFDKVHWMTHLISLIGVAFGAKMIHDHLVNEVVKGRTSDAAKLLAISILTLCMMSCGSSPAARQAAREVEETQKIVLPEYRTYVEKDPALVPDQKDRRRKLVESLERLTTKLQDALKE